MWKTMGSIHGYRVSLAKILSEIWDPVRPFGCTRIRRVVDLTGELRMTRDGTRVVFDLDFDQGAWPGPLSGKDAAAGRAVAGEVWLGPLGLLGRVELGLGLIGLHASAMERALALAGRLAAFPDAFFAASFRVDPIGTARRLLAWRDALRMHRWQAEPGKETGRVAALAEATRELPAGSPERIQACLAALQKLGAQDGLELGRLEVLVDEAEETQEPGGWKSLPPLWRDLVCALAGAGVEVIGRALRPVEARGDLLACREKDFRPAADGSLRLLRPAGVLEAADQAAAWVRSLGEDAEILVVNPDPVLDEALARHGCATTGAGASSELSSLQSVLPLVLGLAWSPPDPELAWRLLCLPKGPFPRDLAMDLLGALHRWPSVGSRRWVEGVERWKARKTAEPDEDGTGEPPADPAYVERVLERLAGVFDPLPGAPRHTGKAPVALLQRRIELVEGWLRPLVHGDHALDGAGEALAQCAALRGLLEAWGVVDISQIDLSRLVGHATSSGGGRRPALAGIASVPSPGCVAGPVRHVLWWGFCARPGAATTDFPPLAGSEQRALAAGGVELPEPTAEAVRASRRERRPLDQSSQAVLLVCPRQGTDGEEAFPAAPWDRVRANLPAGEWHLVEKLAVRRLPADGLPEARPVAARPRLAAKAVVSMAHTVELPGSISPTSLESLVGCPYRGLLTLLAHVDSGPTCALDPPGAPAGRGSLAHAVLEHVLLGVKDGRIRSEGEAGRAARAFLDAEVAKFDGRLAAPWGRLEQGAAIRLVEQAASDLVGKLLAAGLVVDGVEQVLEAAVDGLALNGRADLVVRDNAGKPLVVDLKLGGKKRYLQLRAGTALQLACYARMLATDRRSLPRSAFYTLTTRRLLGAGVFPGAEEVAGPAMEVTWKAILRAVEGIREGLARLEVRVPGIDEGGAAVVVSREDAGAVEGGRLRLPPDCGYCELGVLCGRAFAPAAVKGRADS